MTPLNPAHDPELETANFDLSWDNRFGGLGRLYGQAALERLRKARIAVIGLGGVGSWAAESLARSGIGRIDLIDLDDSCVTNTNRQMHAMDGNYGQPKAQILADRLRLINPEIDARDIVQFVTPRSIGQLISKDHDFVIDATDSVPDKACIFKHCRTLSIPLALSGGSGGKTDPSAIRWSDLGLEQGDPLLKSTKKRIRQDYSYSPSLLDSGKYKGKEYWGAWCVWSREPAVMPWETCGTAQQPPQGKMRIDCASGYGAASFLTGSFGFALASLAIRVLVLENPTPLDTPPTADNPLDLSSPW